MNPMTTCQNLALSLVRRTEAFLNFPNNCRSSQQKSLQLAKPIREVCRKLPINVTWTAIFLLPCRCGALSGFLCQLKPSLFDSAGDQLSMHSPSVAASPKPMQFHHSTAQWNQFVQPRETPADSAEQQQRLSRRPTPALHHAAGR